MNALLCHLKLAWPLSWECVKNMALHAAHSTLPCSNSFTIFALALLAEIGWRINLFPPSHPLVCYASDQCTEF